MGKSHKFSAGGKKQSEAKPEEIEEGKNISQGQIKQMIGIKRKLIRKIETEMRNTKYFR